jgi:hypothetical protein
MLHLHSTIMIIILLSRTVRTLVKQTQRAEGERVIETTRFFIEETDRRNLNEKE